MKTRASTIVETLADFPKPDFKKTVWIFVIASVLGTVIETVFCLIVHREFQVRQGLIYGPFSQVYGIGAIVMNLTVLPLVRFRKPVVFAAATLTGGLVEFTCSFLQERIWGTVSWDFSDLPFSLDGRTSLIFMCFWGVLGCVYATWVYPLLNRWIDSVKLSKNTSLVTVVTIFFAVNFAISGLAVERWVERSHGIAPKHEVDAFLDTHYPNQLMEYVYEEMKLPGE